MVDIENLNQKYIFGIGTTNVHHHTILSDMCQILFKFHLIVNQIQKLFIYMPHKSRQLTKKKSRKISRLRIASLLFYYTFTTVSYFTAVSFFLIEENTKKKPMICKCNVNKICLKKKKKLNWFSTVPMVTMKNKFRINDRQTEIIKLFLCYMKHTN